MTWKNPYWGSLDGPLAAMRPIIASLEEFLADPTFENGVNLGTETDPTYDPTDGTVALAATPKFHLATTNSVVSGGSFQSDNYVTGESGWSIDGDGNAEFNDVTARGVFQTAEDGNRLVILHDGSIGRIEFYTDDPDELQPGLIFGGPFLTGEAVSIQSPVMDGSFNAARLVLMADATGNLVDLTADEVAINGDLTLTGDARINAASTADYIWHEGATNTWHFVADDATPTVIEDGNIASTIQVGTVTEVSSRSSKKNIRPLGGGALAIVNQLQPIRYEPDVPPWTPPPRRPGDDRPEPVPPSPNLPTERVGLVAEDVAAVLPEVIGWAADGVTPRGISYGRLVPILVAAIQELAARP